MDTREERKKVEDALRQINEWCKEQAIEDCVVMVDRAVSTSRDTYRLYISKCYGLAAMGSGRFARDLRIDANGQNLIGSQVGTEIVYNWMNIKNLILRAIRERKEKNTAIMNFKL